METPNYISDSKGNFYVPFETDLVTGYLPVDIPKVKDPVLRWKGPKINVETEWYPATNFMFNYQKHEVVLRLFVTADKKSIVIRPLTQYYGTGMSVREAPTDDERKEIMALGLIDIGSAHSHCTGKAFASGTDVNDEKNWPGGLHLTVGELDEDKYDLHSRFAWDMPGLEENGKVVRRALRILQAPHLRDWFLLPEHVDRFLVEEEELENAIVNYILTKPVDSEYPAWWKEKLIDPPKTGVTYGVPGFGNSGEMFSDTLYFKSRKKRKGNDVEDFQRRRWTAWQRAMTILSEYQIARENKWVVDDFKPELRDKLLNIYPIAKEILDKFQVEIKKLGLTEEEVFNPWNWEVS